MNATANSKRGRELIERVLDHLNYERGRTYPFSKSGLADWYAYVEASETCAAIIRNWNKRPVLCKRREALDRHDVRGGKARKAAA